MWRKTLRKALAGMWRGKTAMFDWKTPYGTEILEDESGCHIRHVTKDTAGDDVKISYKAIYDLDLTMAQYQGMLAYVAHHLSCDPGEERVKEELLLVMEHSHHGTDTAAISLSIITLMAMIIVGQMLSMYLAMPAWLCVAVCVLLGLPLLTVINHMAVAENRAWQAGKDGTAAEVCASLLKMAQIRENGAFAGLPRAPLIVPLAAAALIVGVHLLPDGMLDSREERMDAYLQAYGVTSQHAQGETLLEGMKARGAAAYIDDRLTDPVLPGAARMALVQMAGELAAEGFFTPEQTASWAEAYLSQLTAETLADLPSWQLPLLRQVVAQASPAFLRTYPASLAAEEAAMTALGSGYQAEPAEVIIGAAEQLQGRAEAQRAFLNAAVQGWMETEYLPLLEKAAESPARAALVRAVAAGIATDEKLLSLVRLLKESGASLVELFPEGVPINVRMNRYGMADEPTGGTAEGAVTLLPLRRTELPEDPLYTQYVLLGNSDEPRYTSASRVTDTQESHREDDEDAFIVVLDSAMLDAMPLERLPASAGDADVVLLFDTQFVRHGWLTVLLDDSVGSKACRDYAAYACVQRVAVYTSPGECLRVLAERTNPPRTDILDEDSMLSLDLDLLYDWRYVEMTDAQLDGPVRERMGTADEGWMLHETERVLQLLHDAGFDPAALTAQ